MMINKGTELFILTKVKRDSPINFVLKTIRSARKGFLESGTVVIICLNFLWGFHVGDLYSVDNLNIGDGGLVSTFSLKWFFSRCGGTRHDEKGIEGIPPQK